MKSSKLKALLKRGKRAHIYELANTQYLSDGFAIYLADMLPNYTHSSLLAELDVTLKDLDKWQINTFYSSKTIDLSDTVDDEIIIDEVLPNYLHTSGEILKPLLVSNNEAIFINTKYLAPLFDGTDLDYYVRTLGSGKKYIVVKAGLMLKAAIMPFCEFSSFEINHIESLARLTSKAKPTGESQLMVDTSTGEVTFYE